MTIWSSKKLELSHKTHAKYKFLIRMEKDDEAISKVFEEFGEVEEVHVDGIDNEYGFITALLSEEIYREKIQKLEGIISSIRVMFD